MPPPVDQEVDGEATEAPSDTAGGSLAIPDDWVPERRAELKAYQDEQVHRLEKMTERELMAMAGIDPIMSTSEAAEYFNRTAQWIYWGLKPDADGNQVFVWDDGTPIIPERIGDPDEGRRRFDTTILRGILLSSYRRGNIEPTELQQIIRRIRYTELGVEWRQREGWVYANLGRNRHRWIRREDAYFDAPNKTWRPLSKKPVRKPRKTKPTED